MGAWLAKVLGVRPEDRRDTAVGFATLVAILAAHSMLETARDALFLGKLPVEQLPFAYLAIAVLALVVSKGNQWATSFFPRRTLLSLSLAVGGFVTAGFYTITASNSAWVLGGLYVWSGLTATVVVVQFWLQLADVLDVGQAKRLFSLIAAGGVFGATIGSGTASILVEVLSARDLLLVAGTVFVLAGILPLGFSRGDADDASPLRKRRRNAGPRRMSLGEMGRDPYLRRLFVMVMVGALLVTGVDFLFKAKVVAEAENQGWNLGVFLGRYYAGLNAVSLLVQLFVAPRLLSAVGVNRALLVMPGLMLLGSIGFAATIGLIPALLLKGADGTLRHSVHRTASEILYLPLPRHTRDRFKAFAEAVGQRGGQALASLIILGVTRLTADAQLLAFGLVGLAATFVVTMWGMEPFYLDLFRKQLREGAMDFEIDIPDLDLASFETLVSALSSADDMEVVAALDMFEIYGKTDLVPALILYHPSHEVVLRAFEMFARSDRDDVVRLTGRLLKDEDPLIRAAALRTFAASGANEEAVRPYLKDESPAVQCTALVALMSMGAIDRDEADQALRERIRRECGDTHVALAQALGYLPPEDYVWLAEELARQKRPDVLMELGRAIGQRPHPKHIPVLIKLLRWREGRREARDALVGLGEPALDKLAQALDDLSLSPELRRHIPRTIAQFASQRAFDILFEAILRERDDWVRWKLLRSLGRLRYEHPELEVDRDRVMDQARQTMRNGVRALHWRLVVGRVVARQRKLAPSSELLVAFLEEKQDRSVQEVFRLLHVIEPREEFRIIYDALKGGSAKAQASSRELLQHVVPSPLREGVLAMVGDAPPRQRLKQARAFYDPPRRRDIEAVMKQVRETDGDAEAMRQLSRVYADTLRDMLGDPSEALRQIVSYHVEELGIDELTTLIDDAARTSDVLGEVAPAARPIVAFAEPSHAG